MSDVIQVKMISQKRLDILGCIIHQQKRWIMVSLDKYGV